MKSKKLYFGFVDLVKAFDRVPTEAIRWAMRKLCADEWLVSAVMSVYVGERTVVRTVHTTTTPQPFYRPFSGTTWVSQCQKRTSGLYGARED